jgi:Ca2+-binding RTX toxin-like protein
MATTNYSVSKSSAAASLNSSTLPSDIVAKILSNLDAQVKVVKFDSLAPLTAPTGATVKGKDLVLIDPNNSVNLSSISKENIKGVDAFIFTTNEDVNFTLSGSNTLAFKGVITTNAGDDNIKLNSNVGVTVSSGDGDDSVITGSGHDSVKLGAGNDTVNTGAGNDSVSTGSGNDTVNTGGGDDTVFVGSGDTVVNMGSGNDTAKLNFGFSGIAKLNGGDGSPDKLDLRLVNIDTVSSSDAQLIITLEDGSVIQATKFEKFIYDNNPSSSNEEIVIVGAHQLDDNY